MAIAKWIQFGNPQATPNESTKPDPVPPVSSADAKKFGFENFGNTCYANSVLQALYFCAPFRELLLQTTHPVPVPQPPPQLPSPQPTAPRPKPPRKYSAADPPIPNGSAHPHYPPIPSSPPTLVSALRSLFFYISKHPEDKGVVAPRAFIDKLKEVNELFRSTMHQDAHEFLNYLLNKVVEEIEEERRQQPATPPSQRPPPPPTAEDLSNSIVTLASQPNTFSTAASSNSGAPLREATLVHKLFEGTLTSETRCLTCETVSSRDESFLDLSIDIEQNSSVTACLRQFSASEMLCQKNKFFCDSCCDLQEAEKRMKIKKLPNILALHLKRFKYQEDVQRYIKLTYRVAFPFELRLFNTVDDIEDADRLYELFAIVVHIGNGPHHGHYISLVKTRGSWLVFDDDVVDAVRESDIPRYFGDSNSGSAYVLYYQAVDVDLAGLGLREAVPPLDKAEPVATSPQSSPVLPAPAFPPGLAEEGDSSDMGDLLPPVAVVTGPETQSGKIQPLRSNGMHPEDASNTLLSPNITSPQGATSTIGGLLQSLRRGPTVKPRVNTAESRKSYTEPSPKPSIPPPPTQNEDQAKVNAPTSPPAVLSVANGKDKQAERKASTWFKRKGARMRPDSASEPASLSMISPPAEGQNRTTFLPLPHAGQYTPSRISGDESAQHASDSPQAIGALSLPTLNPVSFGLGISPHIGGDRHDGYDSTSAGSVSSSFASTSAIPAHHPHPDLSTNPLAPPMAPALSRRPQTPSPVGTLFARQPDKSLPHLTHKPKKSFDPYEGEFKPLPQRPLSASEGPKNSQLIPPVPRLSRPTLSEGSEATLMDRRDRDRSVDPGRLHTDSHTPRPPGEPPQPSESGLSPPPPAPSTASSGSTASNGLIRVTRKLSLSAPMLGFGRKDKEKQKDKDKDKEKDRDRGAVPQVSTFGTFSITPRI